MDIQAMYLNVVIVLKVQRLTCPKGGALTPITSGVAFELMQDSTVILLDRQLFATKAKLGQVIASLDGGPDCFCLHG
jgi:hypothetical protein